MATLFNNHPYIGSSGMPVDTNFGMVVTLCPYVQQHYVFGRVGLCTYMYVCIYVCEYICGQKMGCLGSYRWKISRWCITATACSSSLTAKKGAYYARRFICERNLEPFY